MIIALPRDWSDGVAQTLEVRLPPAFGFDSGCPEQTGHASVLERKRLSVWLMPNFVDCSRVLLQNLINITLNTQDVLALMAETSLLCSQFRTVGS